MKLTHSTGFESPLPLPLLQLSRVPSLPRVPSSTLSQLTLRLIHLALRNLALRNLALRNLALRNLVTTT
jgi:hypothetical protein